MNDPVLLSELTTLRLGGPAERYVAVESEAELIDLVRAIDEGGGSLLVLGGGSNVVVGDAGVPGTVVHVRTRGARVERVDSCGGAFLRVAAGEPWDDVVALASTSGWSGIECLSGIPGSAGATPLQNVGAYGQEIAQTLARLRVWDRAERRIRTFPNLDCRFGYRTSRFRHDARFVVLDVTFQLRLGRTGEPVRYPELADALGVEVGARAPLADVRAAVLELRASKGMVLDEHDHDTWSAGSFFTNPVLPPADVPAGAPSWPLQPTLPTLESMTGAAPALVKTSAAWLIEHAGFHRGYPGPDAPASLSTKHSLALTNRGSASSDDVLALAAQVRDGVRARFDIDLEPEPVLVGTRLPT